MHDALLHELTLFGPLANSKDGRQLSWRQVKAEQYLHLRMRVEEEGGEAMEREWPASDGVLDLLTELRKDFCARFPAPGHHAETTSDSRGPESNRAA